jgi:hypothetical protein
LSSASPSRLPEVPEIPASAKGRLIAFLVEKKKGRNSKAEMWESMAEAEAAAKGPSN